MDTQQDSDLLGDSGKVDTAPLGEGFTLLYIVLLVSYAPV